MSEFRSIVRGWIDLLRDPGRVSAAKEALDKALDEARAEGFAKAREMAAARVSRAAKVHEDWGRLSAAMETSLIADDIRAMQDDKEKTT